jgi:hypothetical protein
VADHAEEAVKTAKAEWSADEAQAALDEVGKLDDGSDMRALQAVAEKLPASWAEATDNKSGLDAVLALQSDPSVEEIGTHIETLKRIASEAVKAYKVVNVA